MQAFHVVSDIRPLTDTKQISQTIKGQVKASLKKGIDTRVIMPLYKQIKDKIETENIARDSIFIGEKEKYLGVEYKEIDGVKYYFIDNMEYFYRDNHFGYDDDGERYTYFCYAVLKSLELINVYPDIFMVWKFQKRNLQKKKRKSRTNSISG